MEIKADGRTFQGETFKDVAIAMWQARYTMTDIAKYAGCSRSWVGAVLNKAGYFGRHGYPELGDPTTFMVSDVEVAGKLRVPESRVKSARLGLGIRRVKPVDISDRRLDLCQYLFGEVYSPGPRFVSWAREVSNELLTEKQFTYLENFYLSGLRDGIGRKRLYRHYARKRLKEKLQTAPEGLVREKVLIALDKTTRQTDGVMPVEPKGGKTSL